MADEQYNVRIRGDYRDYQQGTAQAVSATDQLTSSLGRLAVGLGAVAQRGNQKLTLFSAAEAATITGLTVAAARYDQQTSQLQAHQVMLNKSTSAYKVELNGIRTEMGLTTADSIALVTQLSRMNVPFSQQQQQAKEYVKLAAVTGDSVTGLAQSQTMFMRQIDPQQGGRNIERYSSSVANLNAKMGASAQGTLDFANSITPLSKSMGMSATEILGISGSFSKAGQDGYAAGTVYTKVLTDVNRAIQYGSPEIKVYSDLLGTTVDRFKAMPKAEVVTQIFEALNKEGPQAIKTLDRLGLDGVRSQRAISAVLGQGGLREGIKVANDGFGDTSNYEKASAKALQGTNDNLAKARESVTGFGQAVGGTFLPAADKMSSALVTVLRPLNEFSNLLTKAPTWAKDVGALAAGVAVLAPLLPRMMLGLAGASVLPALAKGSIGQGFMQGLRPGRDRTEAQAAFTRGEGSRGYRGLYRAGLLVGDRFNFGGRGGNLSDVDFQGPDGEQVRRRGSSEYTREMIQRLGLIDPEVAEQRRQRGTGTRATNRTTGFLADIARSQLRPWNVDYQQNSARDSMRNPDTILGNARSTFGKLFSKEGFEENLKQVKTHASALRTAADEARNNTIRSRADFRDTHGVFRNLVRESTSLGLSTARAGVGVGYAGVRAGAGLAARGAQGLLAAGGGPAGLAIAGGLALGGMVYQGFQTRRAARQDDGVDNSAGSDYRNALGIASKATKSFADVVAQSATQMNATVSSVSDAINVTADDIKKASGRTDQIVDANLKTMNLTQATTYAGAVMPGADPREVQAMKYDLIARFGGDTAQSVLNQAKGGTAGNLFSLVGPESQTVGKGPFSAYNDIYASKETSAAGQMVADTAKTQIGRASVNEGSAGVGKMQQSLLNQYVSEQVESIRKGGSSRLTDPVNAARYGALSQAMGLDEKDSASQKALQRVVTNLSGERGLTGGALNDAITNQLGTNLGGTDLGAKRAQAQQMGGVYRGSNYLAADPQANPFGMLGGTLDTLRTTALGKRLTGDLAANAPGSVAFQGALDNEGNADMQSRAVREALDNSIRANKGNYDAVNAEMVAFKNNAGAASSQASVLADAMIAASQQARGYANVVGGTNTLGTRMEQAQGDFTTAQSAYQKTPDAPGAYERVESSRQAMEATNVEATQKLNEIAGQYRQLDIQRKQGQEQLAYSEQRTREDYYRQAGYAESDFARQRSRNAYSFALQQSRTQADFNLQRGRAESDYQRNRRRQEQDFNHQLVLMAEQSAKQVYDVYSRVTVQRTMSGTNLLQNMEDQQKRIDEQQANLAKARKMGLSNKTISQLGLNESANSQQLERLLSDMAEDPKLTAKYNSATKKRQKSAGDLTKDPANTQYTEMVRAQKLATSRADDDFARSMSRQQRDFRTSVARMRKDYATQMGQAVEDFAIMRDRQRRQMEIGFVNQRKDFARQMRISERNISTFAEDITLSFDSAFKITASRTRGETRKQIKAMGDLLDKYNTLIVGKNNDVKDSTKKIFSEFGGSFYKQLSEKEIVKNTSMNLGYDIGGGYHDGGATANVGEYQAAGVVHGGEHVATKREVDSTPGGHRTWERIRHAVREGDTDFLQALPGYGTGGAVKDPDKRVSVDGKALSKIAAMQLALAKTVSGINLHVMQGGFGGSHVAASGTSHNYPGVADVSPGSVAVEKILRQVGFAAWARNISGRASVGSGAHVHAVSLIDPGNKGHAQFGSWSRHEDGLRGGKDPAPHYALLANLMERLGASNLSVLAGGGPSGPLLTLPKFGDMKMVKAHGTMLREMGMTNIGGLTDRVLPSLMLKKYIDEAVNKFGKDVFNPNGGGGTIGGGAAGGGTNREIGKRMLLSAGFDNGEWDPLNKLWTRESGWRTNAKNPSSGAYGIPQSLPGSKMASAGSDWKSNPATQIKWGLGYIKDRYKNPSGAWAHSQRTGWYERGSESIPEGWHITGENGPEMAYFGQGGKVKNNTATMHAVLKSKAAQVVTPQANGPTTNNNTYDHSNNVSVAEAKVYAADLTDFQNKLEAEARRKALTSPRAVRSGS